jgi:hypothetical protein
MVAAKHGAPNTLDRGFKDQGMEEPALTGPMS